MTQEDVIRMAIEAKYYTYVDGIRVLVPKDTDDHWAMLKRFAETVAYVERGVILEAIDQLTDDRHPMFAEGYHLALDHVQQFIEGRFLE
jgi:hypothetical protein